MEYVYGNNGKGTCPTKQSLLSFAGWPVHARMVLQATDSADVFCARLDALAAYADECAQVADDAAFAASVPMAKFYADRALLSAGLTRKVAQAAQAAARDGKIGAAIAAAQTASEGAVDASECALRASRCADDMDARSRLNAALVALLLVP
ncbi:hypothetical protein ACLKMY_32905 [Paraburkholderia mimosarum]|uniref:hypothetical protein n=1 Tax=Paraburkholderia mimosarum TaxID=312026 RepID=UPI0039C41F1A